MAHFAKIGLNNKVIEILSVHSDALKDSNGIEQEVNGIDFLNKLTGWSIWVQTSYNSNFRKNFAAVGDTYDKTRDAFITVKPFASWVLDEATCKWKAPTDCPGDISDYYWDEDALSWAQE